MWYFRSYEGKMYAKGTQLATSVAPFQAPGTLLEVWCDVLIQFPWEAEPGHSYVVLRLVVVRFPLFDR